VQPDRLGDLLAEPLAEPVRARVVVPVVGAAHQVMAADGRGEMADVVQQSGRDQRWGRPGLLRQRRRLQHV
jgi:hypothetical protein